MDLLKRKITVFCSIVCVMAMMSGCQTISDHNAAVKEKMLADAGFQMKKAQTPEQLKDIEGLPQRKLVPNAKDGRVTYVYADASGCKCVYAGTEENYKRYREIVDEKKMDDEREINNEANLDWQLWGPFDF